MTDRSQMTRTSSGFFVSQEAPIETSNPIPTPTSPAPDILRCAYMELVVTDLAASRIFYVDILGLHITEENDEAIYLRSTEEFIHHNLVLRQGPVAAVAAFSYRVRSAEDLDKAVAFYEELGCEVRREPNGFTKGIGDSVRVVDPLGFPYEFFFDTEHQERLSWRYDLYSPGELVRLDHFNQITPDVPRAVNFMQSLGFRVTEDIQDEEGVVYAAWMRRKPTVHDTAMTGGDGPRMHHVCFATHEKHNILSICDKLGALRRSDAIERGPGRHGVSNAFSTCTCAIPTATASRSTRRTTTPATPTTRSSRGTCTTTSAATGGATPSCRRGTPRARSCSTSTASPSPCAPAPTRARWP
ncbi:catechol 2,3-dioxygenase [Microbacterium testaceum]|nr:catechol 2,3-dioxygenase [Microbacterium testaceum]